MGFEGWGKNKRGNGQGGKGGKKKEKYESLKGGEDRETKNGRMLCLEYQFRFALYFGWRKKKQSTR